MAEDQHRVKVSLTAPSRTLAATMAPQIEAVYQAIELHIGREFIGSFYAALDELIEMLGDVPEPTDE